MQRLVRDYTLAGDLIADPFGGAASTLVAASLESRFAIGAEMNPDTFAKAQRRIARGCLPTFDVSANG
jgi:DNA modification methylase